MSDAVDQVVKRQVRIGLEIAARDLHADDVPWALDLITLLIEDPMDGQFANVAGLVKAVRFAASS